MSDGIKLGDLKKMIVDTVAEAVKGDGNSGSAGTGEGKGETDSTPPNTSDRRKSVAEQVTEALANIEKGKKQAERDKTIDEQLAKLSEVTKEKPPIERSRRHKIMGWGEPTE